LRGLFSLDRRPRTPELTRHDIARERLDEERDARPRRLLRGLEHHERDEKKQNLIREPREEVFPVCGALCDRISPIAVLRWS
jgi:hypothetical protein